MSHDNTDIRANEPVRDADQALAVLRRVPIVKTISRATYNDAIEVLALELEKLKEVVRWTE